MMSNETLLTLNLAYPLILGSCLIGFLFGMLNWSTVKDVDTEKKPEASNHILTTPVKGNTPLDLMNKTSKLIQEVEYF
jgi:hypothetical protein